MGWSPGSFWTFQYFSHRPWKPSFKIRHHTNTNTGWVRLAREAWGGVLLSYFKLQKHLWHLNILLKNINALIRVYVKACRCAFVVETLCYWNEIANFDTREIDFYLATTSQSGCYHVVSAIIALLWVKAFPYKGANIYLL